jgi:AcrR family transcriptional regulator
MPRTLNPEAHALRRDAFVDAARRLIQAKGYEQMSIQDVLDDLGTSKGAFYHYFGSREDLLEAVVERMADDVVASLTPITSDARLAPLEKLEQVFAGLAAWKAEQKDLMLVVLGIWLSDHNAIVREKLRRASATRLVPLLAAIIRQGSAEGQFTATCAEDAARIVATLFQGAGDVFGELFVARQAGAVPFEAVERTFASYTEAVERILGAPAGSVTIADRPTLLFWYG